jgi:hypothetical protein
MKKLILLIVVAVVVVTEFTANAESIQLMNAALKFNMQDQ